MLHRQIIIQFLVTQVIKYTVLSYTGSNNTVPCYTGSSTIFALSSYTRGSNNTVSSSTDSKIELLVTQEVIIQFLVIQIVIIQFLVQIVKYSSK